MSLSGSYRTTDATGQWAGDEAELDPLGADAGLVKPFVWTPVDKEELAMTLHPYPGFGDLNTPGGKCTLDGLPINCSEVAERVNRGAAKMKPGDEFLAILNRSRGSGHFASLHQQTYTNSVYNGEPSPGEWKDYWSFVWIPDDWANAYGPQSAHGGSRAQQNASPQQDKKLRDKVYQDCINRRADERLSARQDRDNQIASSIIKGVLIGGVTGAFWGALNGFPVAKGWKVPRGIPGAIVGGVWGAGSGAFGAAVYEGTIGDWEFKRKQRMEAQADTHVCSEEADKFLRTLPR